MCNLEKLVSIKNPCVNTVQPTGIYSEIDINGFDMNKYASISKQNISGYTTLINERKKAYNSLLLQLQQRLTVQKTVFNTQNLNKQDRKTGAFVQIFDTVATKKGIRISKTVNSSFTKTKLEKVSIFPNNGVTSVFFTVAIVQNGEYLYLPFNKTVTAGNANTFDFTDLGIVSEGDIFIYFENGYSLKSTTIKEFCQVCGGGKSKKPFKTENITVANDISEIEYVKNNGTSANGIIAEVNVFCDFERFLCETGLYANLAEPLLTQLEINLITAKRTAANINYFTITSNGEEMDKYRAYLEEKVMKSLDLIATSISASNTNSCDCVKSTVFRMGRLV